MTLPAKTASLGGEAFWNTITDPRVVASYRLSLVTSLIAAAVNGVFGIILAVGTAVGVLAQKLRVPDVVVFLLVGLFLGPGAAGVLEVKADSALNQLILIFGACYILFDGGASLRLKVLKNDKRAVFTAASHAQKADYLSGLQKPQAQAA